MTDERQSCGSCRHRWEGIRNHCAVCGAYFRIPEPHVPGPQGYTHLSWVPGHTGHPGEERATIGRPREPTRALAKINRENLTEEESERTRILSQWIESRGHEWERVYARGEIRKQIAGLRALRLVLGMLP